VTNAIISAKRWSGSIQIQYGWRQFPGRAVAWRITSNTDSPLGEHNSMDKIIANLNIEHYNRLRDRRDERESIARLIADEEARRRNAQRTKID
jgi:hypothetical protein